MINPVAARAALGAKQSAAGSWGIDAQVARGYASWMKLQLTPELIVMPGRDRSTADEMAMLVHLAGVASEVSTYSFWDGDHSNPDLEAEVSALVRKAPTYVAAKSIGSLITMLARRDQALDLRAAFFLGVPVHRLRQEGRMDLLVDHCRSTPTTIIQRRADPTGAFAELAQAVAASSDAVLIEVPGDTHSYADDEVAAALRGWWSGLRVQT